MEADAPFTLERPKVGHRVWQPGFVITGKQMQMFVGKDDQPNQGLLFGEIAQEALQDDESCRAE